MALMKWLPWRFIVRRMAKAHGYLDPLTVMAQLERFSQPSEVSAPVELLRAGLIFYSRGFMNARAIQQNLDWVWPYWVRRQFDPDDPAFLPRAFSTGNVNLTQRNWTAVGLPDCEALPIVDPRGLLTPWHDGWSLDAWVLADDGAALLPPRTDNAEQIPELGPASWAVRTRTRDDDLRLETHAEVHCADGDADCVWTCSAEAKGGGWLVVALRPFNPEGVSAIDRLALDEDRRAWSVGGTTAVRFDEPAERHTVSDYAGGDVWIGLAERSEKDRIRCKVGLATAAALWRIEPGAERSVTTRVPLAADRSISTLFPTGAAGTWSDALGPAAELSVPDERMQMIYDAGLRALVLHAARDIYPGPYTYKRFWFRDAALILHPMVALGLAERARRMAERFPKWQTVTGYFHSQEGEWDANGEVLWALGRMARLTGEGLDPDRWKRSVLAAARWIQRKRTARDDVLHGGLLPAGFSAEHFGNNDYYYWDDFWSVAGLKAAAGLAADWGVSDEAEAFRAEADDLAHAIEETLARSRDIRKTDALPASPYRRMDAGAIGSLAADYPLRLWPAGEPRLAGTVEWLIDNCFRKNAFFHAIAHAGLNPYLTLHVAQVLLRAGDERFFPLVEAVRDLASSTGQWPEAVHPQDGGGCMGDGQHIWAVAEWLMMMRTLFVREEEGRLILGSGLPAGWLGTSGTTPLRFGPTLTPWGPVTVRVVPSTDAVEVTWKADWRGAPPRIDVVLAGCGARESVDAGAGTVRVPRS